MTTSADPTRRAPDPINELIPPPRRWWGRLLIAAAILGVVTVGSAAYGLGYVYPQPDCCGSGSGGPAMSLSTDGQAVMVTAYFYNSSGRTLRITGAHATLPGATVLDLGGLEEGPVPTALPYDAEAFPIVVGGHASALIAITFVPHRCNDSQDPWGTVTVDLEIANAPWPTIDRTFELPDPVASPFTFTVWGVPEREATDIVTTPLAAACALLGIDD